MIAFLGLFLVTSAYAQTCDLTLISQTPPATTEDDHSFVIEFVNAENCGCNEFTQYDGNTCDGNGSSSVNNNENVSHLVFGIHYVNEITGQDLGENTDCTSTTFHPGWSYTNVTNWGGWETGDVVTININPPFAWECILATPLEGYCWEVVIWQINLSQTAGIDDFPDNGWTVGNSFNQTQTYPDINIDDNRIAVCYDPCVPDTIIEYITDTIYIETIDTLYVTDTIIEYVDNFITDTLYVETIDTVYVDVEVFVEVFITDTITEIEYITEYVTDTLFITTVDTVEVIVYEFLTDTIYEYITIDCETGLECIDDPGLTCPDWTSVYLPNTFTPNNDGLNDTWVMVYDLDCWVDVEFKIFNRWGDMIYSGKGDYFDSYPYWDGSVDGGDHYASDGVYTYTFYAKKFGSTEVFQRHGHITIFR